MTTRWRPPPRPEHALTVRLTPSEARILSFLALGWGNQAIADRLHVSLQTVRTHNKRIYAAMGARNRTDAAILACLGHVLIDVDEKGRGA